MALRVYNVRTRQKDPFVPLDPEGKKVGLYQCGLTVYDHMHIGHARTAVSFEVIRRWLERQYEVRFVKNVTDVDDKIIASAVAQGISPLEHADKWDKECAAQGARLGVREADVSPHATTSMTGIIAFIEGIIANGFAYATDAGNVYFDVPGYDAHAEQHFPEFRYGHLSRRDYREMASGTRKEVEGDKRHPADFALWKAAKETEPTDAQWDSPWSKGRPGWHIECSHMSMDALQVEDPSDPHYGRIDIHGGGQDLIFPHHENEIAQSQARTGQAPFVNVWLHTGFLNVEGVKMSKSLNNYITLKEELDRLEAAGVDPEALRFYYTQTHYRSKIDFSRAGLDEAIQSAKRLRRTREELHAVAERGEAATAPGDEALTAAAAQLQTDFDAAMDDDFGTPNAVAALFGFQRVANAQLDAATLSAGATRHALQVFETCARVLTLFEDDLASGDQDIADAMRPLLTELGITTTSEAAAMEQVLAARAKARADKDWGTADRIRDAVAAAGYIVEDGKDGARWRRA